MALLDLLEISKSYETQKILEEVSLFINQGERIAIIGKNGGGKSTLMKIINGTLEPDAGRRIVQSGISVEMLAQVPVFDPKDTVRQAIEKELERLYQVRKEFEEVSLALAKNPESAQLLERQDALTGYLDLHNAWSLDDKIERVMQEFALKIFEHTPVSLLSGGEQRRVALAGLILKKPDILLLDEPTNHLDVYMVAFLEEMLLKENVTLVFISHDRYFIDRLATRSIEIEECKLRSFEGGYQAYLSAKEMLLHAMQKHHDVLLKHLKGEEEWLRRGVKARLKRNEGRKQRVFEMREAAKKNPSQIRKITLELERAKHAFNQDKSTNRQKMLFELHNVGKTLGDKRLIANFTARILQNDRIAIVGKNGAGKSTLLRLLLGTLTPDEGVLKKGEFSIGYFDQQRAMLDDEKNLLETFCPNGGDRVEVRGSSLHVYGYLKQFLFPKEYLDKKIGLLSGGEKNRVALALLFAKPVDCLILDEPTNDLDIPTINVLESFIESFQGAVLVVSHDRYFVDKVAKKMFVFMGDGLIEESYQTYTEFLEMEQEIAEAEASLKTASSETSKKQKTGGAKLSYKEQQEYETLPQRIETLEAEIASIKACLGNPECYQKEGIGTLTERLHVKEELLEPLVERFLEIEEKRELLGL